MKITAPTASATCSVDGGGATIAPPTWAKEILGCKEPSSALQQVDCSADQVCAPKPGPPFEAKLCILQAGDVACPPPPYLNRRLVYTGTADTRGCAPCTCTVPSQPCTGGIVYTGPSSTCPPSGGTTAFGACFSQGNFAGPRWLVAATPPAVTCIAAGGTPTGALTPTTPVTVCCM